VAEKKKKSFSYPYPRPGLTVDIALVTVEARPRILLVQRGGDPFKGSWALPGGFVDENEPLVDAARRELLEETGLKQSDLEQLHTFGDPGRDPRGWTVSVVFLARVRSKELKPIAGDDAAEVGWFSLSDPPPLAFDHAEILLRVRTRLAD
jgi:8-oxo-dGTP diphosphatase